VTIESTLRVLVAEAGLDSFVPTRSSYEHLPGLVIEPLDEIEPPVLRTFIDRERALSILAGVREGAVIPPVEVERFPTSKGAPRQLRLHHGFHRYHLSVALGFTHIPVVERPYFDYEP
jgi:hypothetical protein